MSASLDSEKFKTSPVELHPMLAFGWRSCGAVGGTDGGQVTFHEEHPLVSCFLNFIYCFHSHRNNVFVSLIRKGHAVPIN